MIKDNNYITIQGWMINRLGLKGPDLLVYAVIYGFSQDNESVFSGSAKYLAEWAGVTRECICRTLKDMVEKGLIIKNVKEDGVIEYRINEELLGGEKWCDLKSKGCDLGSQDGCDLESHYNNNIDNIDNKKKNNTLTSVKKKRKYGEFKNVLLTDEEAIKLIEKYEWYFGRAIEELSGRLAEVGDKYKSHYATMRETNWVWEKVHKNPENGTPESNKLFEDPTQQGGLRRITPLEYYSEKYGIETGQPKML